MYNKTKQKNNIIISLIQTFLTGKIKTKKTFLVRFELTYYTLRMLRLIHYTTADDVVKLLLISDIPFQITLLVPYSRRKLAKITENRSEIKLAYATPFELQGQKNTTIIKLQIIILNGTDKYKTHNSMGATTN